MESISDTTADRKRIEELKTIIQDKRNELRDLFTELFNKSANAHYLENTQKTFFALNNYLGYEQNSWADDCHGDEWQDAEECITAAEEKAEETLRGEIEP